MKISKIIIPAAIVAAAVSFAGCGGSSTPGGSHGESAVTVTVVPAGVSSVEWSVLSENALAFGRGWNQEKFTAGIDFANQPSRRSDNDVLRENYAEKVFAKMDSIIVSRYASSPTRGTVEMDSVLSDAYAGIAVIVDSIPSFAAHDKYRPLMADRELYNEVYAFDRDNFTVSPAVYVRLSGSGNQFTVDRQLNLVDFSTIRQSKETQRDRLRQRVAGRDHIAGVRWFTPALSNDHLDQRLRDAEQQYLRNARARLIANMRSISGDSRLADNAEACELVSQQLTNIQGSLPNGLQSSEVTRAFNDAKNTLQTRASRARARSNQN